MIFYGYRLLFNSSKIATPPSSIIIVYILCTIIISGREDPMTGQRRTAFSPVIQIVITSHYILMDMVFPITGRNTARLL